MNEEEKKVEKQEQLFDLGNGRFVDVNKLIQVAQQNDNQDLYTSSWSLGSRRNAIKTSINETLQAIKDGVVTGRNANKTYNFNKDILQQTGRHFDPNSAALDYLNWIFDSEQAPEDFYTQPKPKEEPKKEGPKKYTGSYEETLSKLFPSMEVWNDRDRDDNTQVISGNTNRISQAVEAAQKHLMENKGYDFSESTYYKNEQEFEEAMNAIIEAGRSGNMDDLIAAMSRTGGFKGVNNIRDTYFGIPRQDPPKSKTQAEIDAEKDDADWREYVNTRFRVPAEHQELYSDLNNLTRYSLYDQYQSNTDNISEAELAQLQQQYEKDYKDAMLAIPNLSDDPNVRALQQKAILGLYTDFYEDDTKKKLFSEDKNNAGYVYLDNFIIQNPSNPDMAGYYISFNPLTNSIKYNWIKDNGDILNKLRAAFIQKREDARSIANAHYKVGGVIKMLGGGPTKQDSTYMYSMIGSGFTPKKLTITKKDPVEKAKEELNKVNEQLDATKQEETQELDYINTMKEIDRKKAREAKIAGRNAKIDNWNYAAAGNDLISLILSLSNNPYVDAGATGAGLAAAVERGIANSMDASTPWYSDLGWFLADAGAESLTMLPGWGTAAKLGKAKKAATTILNYLGTGAAVGTLAYLGVAERERLGLALNKIINGDLQSLNTNDIEILTMALGATSSLGSKGISSKRQNVAIKNGKITEQTVANAPKLYDVKYWTSPRKNKYEWQSRKIGRGLDLETTKPTQTTTPTQPKQNDGKINPLRHPLDALEARKAQKAAEQAFRNRVDFYGGNHKKMVDDWVKYGGTTKQLQDAADKLQASGLVKNEMEALEYLSEQLKIKTVPNHVIAELDQLLTPSNKKGGKLNQLKALRKGGILKFEPGGTFEEYKKWYANNYGQRQTTFLDVNNYTNTPEYKEYQNYLNSLVSNNQGVSNNQDYEGFKNYITSIGKDVNQYDESNYKFTEEYAKYNPTGKWLNEPTKVNPVELPILNDFDLNGFNAQDLINDPAFSGWQNYLRVDDNGNISFLPENAVSQQEVKDWLTKAKVMKSNTTIEKPRPIELSEDMIESLKEPEEAEADITWRTTNTPKLYFDGTNYTDLATKDFHAALDAMNIVDRTKGLEALKAAGNDVEAWNQAFNTHFGNINKNIVGYNPEVDNFNGVSTQFRQASINSYKPSAQKAVFELRTNPVDGKSTVITDPTKIELADKITTPEALTTAVNGAVKETYERSAAGRRPNVGGEDQYKKVSGLWDLKQLGIKNGAIADYAKEMGDLTQDNVFRPTAHQIQAPKVTNLFEQRMLKQQQDAQDFFKVGQNLAALNPDQYRQQMLGLVSSQANSDMQFNMQERAHLDQQYQNLAEVGNTNSKARLDAYQEGLKNQLSANLTTGAMLAEANKAIQNNWGDYMTQLKLNQQQDVKDWNAALYSNEVDKASLDYQNAVNYANLHLADDPVAWQEYVDKAANALATVQSNQRNKMYGFKTKQTGPNFGALSAKKGGKLDSETKLQIENSRFLSKQIIQQLKNRDKGLDRLSKITYKTILKSLGLE